MGIGALSSDELQLIMRWLPCVQDKISASRVSTRWRAATASPDVWNELCVLAANGPKWHCTSRRRLSDDDLSHLIARSAGRLEAVVVTDAVLLTERPFYQLSMHPHLRKVDVSGCASVLATDGVFCSSLAQCKKLRQLSVAGCDLGMPAGVTPLMALRRLCTACHDGELDVGLCLRCNALGTFLRSCGVCEQEFCREGCEVGLVCADCDEYTCAPCASVEYPFFCAVCEEHFCEGCEDGHRQIGWCSGCERAVCTPCAEKQGGWHDGCSECFDHRYCSDDG